MPSLDGGHYFLTILAPIRADSQNILPTVRLSRGRGMAPMRVDGAEQELQIPRSHRHLLAQDLALLNTGYQVTRWEAQGPTSPFARNTLNHFARFVIIDNPSYNGRNSGDTLIETIGKVDPLVPQPVDALKRPYLLFAADIDARSGPDPLADYAAVLWSTMAAELTAIFSHCEGFDGIADPAAFTAYLRRCEIETTMPFNDYWPENLQPPPPLPVKTVVAAAVALVLLGVVAIFIWRWLAVLPVAAVLALFVYLAYRWFLDRGRKPFPTAPTSDLNSVLKALYIQQTFTRFAIDVQGEDEASLHRRFGDFLELHKPDKPAPTQAPGLVKAP